MRIGIDISQIIYQGTGVARYTAKLVEYLLKIDKENDYVLFFSSLRRKLNENFSRAEIKKFGLPPSLLDILWNRFHIFPIENFIGKIDIFHCSDWTQPPVKKTRLVTTVHDLTPWKYPQTLHPKIVETHKRRMRWVKKEADLIIADSYSTKEDLIKIIGIPKKKIKVIYLGVEENKAEGESLVEGDYILTVGTREPRKNLKRLINAFRVVIKKNKNVKLVIAGKYGWGNKQLNFKNEQINILGFVPEETLKLLYKHAKVFVYPSLYEGFGLPILEAMAASCPVITSNLSSLPELAGKAAILIDPLSTNSITRAIEKVLEKKDLRTKLIKEGKTQVKKFTWRQTAENTLKAYMEAIRC